MTCGLWCCAGIVSTVNCGMETNQGAFCGTRMELMFSMMAFVTTAKREGKADAYKGI